MLGKRRCDDGHAACACRRREQRENAYRQTMFIYGRLAYVPCRNRAFRRRHAGRFKAARSAADGRAHSREREDYFYFSPAAGVTFYFRNEMIESAPSRCALGAKVNDEREMGELSILRMISACLAASVEAAGSAHYKYTPRARYIDFSDLRLKMPRFDA